MKLKKILPQLLTLLFIILVFGFFTMNAQENMGARGLEFGFGFLKTQASFDIQFSLIDYDGSHTYARAYLVGLLNTLLVAFIGIILATLLGAVVGVARLSPNYLIRKTASFYIEFFRNIPLLLQIFFWYFAALRALPMLEDAPMLLNSSFMTIKGLYAPAPIWTNFDVFFTTIIIAMIIIFFFARFAKKKQEQEGKRLPVLIISLAIFISLPLLTFLIGGVDLSWSYPVIRQMSQSSYTFDGGLKIPPELIALTLALTLYTATFIAEIVRAGIMAVNKGQTEASYALGLQPGPTLRLVVIPQALRVIIPPLTSQYLNLTKNSSLAAAIAYPDLILVFAGTILMQTGQAVEIIAITMGVYLTISLLISGFMNWYNNKMALVER